MLTRTLKEGMDPSGIAADVWLILRWHWIYNYPNPEPSVQRARSIQTEYSYDFKINTDQMESHSTKKKLTCIFQDYERQTKAEELFVI